MKRKRTIKSELVTKPLDVTPFNKFDDCHDPAALEVIIRTLKRLLDDAVEQLRRLKA